MISLVLLLMLSLSVTTSMQEQGYCDAYAAIRQNTPVRYRGPLIIARRAYQLCETKLHLVSRKRICGVLDALWPDCYRYQRHRTTLGEEMKEFALDFETRSAADWVRDYAGIEKGPGRHPDARIGIGLPYLEKAFNWTMDRLISEAELAVKGLPNFFKSTRISEFENSINEITCPLGGISAESLSISDFTNIFNVDGIAVKTLAEVQFIEPKLEKLLKETKDVAITTLYESLTEKLMAKISGLMQDIKLEPLMESMWKFRIGQNPELELVWIKILEGMQTDRFLHQLDLAFEYNCMGRGAFFGSLLKKTFEELSTLSQFINKYIDKNNKIALEGMMTEFKAIFADRLRERADSFWQQLEGFETKIKDGPGWTRLMLNAFLPLVLEQCNWAECPERDILLENNWLTEYHAFLAVDSYIPTYLGFLQREAANEPGFFLSALYN